MNRIFSIVFLFMCVIVFGQPGILDLNFREHIVAPNVDAAAMFKFQEVPVNLSNGLANVSVPLYQITLPGIEIPIALNYHGRGIQVSEIASTVGLGWSLNYGGMVSRQVRDKPDDAAFGYLNHTHYKDILNSATFDVSHLNAQFNIHPQLDLIPDRFFYNIAGFSGEFIFDQKSGAILQQSFTDVKITAKFKERKIIGWMIVDTKGNTYHFGVLNTNDTTVVASEKRVKQSVGYNPQLTTKPILAPDAEYYDSWYLVKIETYNKQYIDYQYDYSRTKYYHKNYDERQGGSSNNSYNTVYSEITEFNLAIKSITYPLGKLVFTNDENYRQDVLGGSSLKSMRQYSLTNELVSGYNFQYETVFNEDISHTYTLLPGLDKSSKYRYFLTQIQKLGNLEEKDGLYVLEYNKTKLPNRFSTSKDMWGYYNFGQNGTAWVLGENKNLGVHGERSEAGILTSITYPTGRKEVFTYEDQYLKVEPKFLKNSDVAEKVEKMIFFNNIPLISEGYDENSTNIPSQAKEYHFTLPVGSENFRISMVENVFQHADHPPGYRECHFVAEIYSNGQIVSPYENPTSTKLMRGEKVRAPGLTGGSYVLKVSGPGGCGRGIAYLLASYRIEISWYEDKSKSTDSNGDTFMLGAGRRIRSIETYEGQHKQQIRSFEYTTEDGHHSGKLFGMPPYNQILETKGHLKVMTPFGMEESSPVGSFLSNSLVYSAVTEYLGTASNNEGKITHGFTDFTDGGGGYYEWPFYLAINNEWKRGLPTYTKYFKKESDNYSLVQESRNSYVFYESHPPAYDLYVRNSFAPAPGNPPMPPFPMNELYVSDRDSYRIPIVRFYRNYYLVINKDMLYDPRFLVNNSSEKLFYKRYYLAGGRYFLEKSETTSYSGNLAMKKTVYNQYNSKKHYQLTASEYTDAQGEVIRNTFVYPGDLSRINPQRAVAQKLVDANNIATPIEVTSSQKSPGSELLYKTINLYKDWGANLVAIKEYQGYKGEQLIDGSKKVLHRDPSNGNIIEFEELGLTTIQLYGYNKSLLIAQIENSTKEEFAAILGVSVDDLTSVDQSYLPRINALRKHANFAESRITTYEHKPLVGVVKIIDANDMLVTYEYDQANRLKAIKDEKGNVLKEYDYNYRIK